MNVTCKRKAWDDADWYRLLNPEGWPFPADEAYVAADETHELNPGQPYPIPECASGCPIKIGQAAGAGVLAVGALAAAGRLASQAQGARHGLRHGRVGS